MPSNIIKSFAKKTNKSEAEVEKLWDKAKILAKDTAKKDNIEIDSGRYYAIVTGILKKMLKIDENINISEFDKIYKRILENIQ